MAFHIKLFFNHSGTGKYTKTFLDGSATTDDGEEIFMRTDTHDIQLMSEIETYSNPISVILDVKRGSSIRVFVATDGEEFYELEGTAKKGVSILKIHSSVKGRVSPKICRKIKISLRDFSKQICRIDQIAITYLPSGVDHAE